MNLCNTIKLIERLKGCEWRGARERVNGRGGFNQMSRLFPCGSPAGIDGHCADLMREAGTPSPIRAYLGVDIDTAHMLYSGDFSPRHMELVRPEEAVEYLERLMREHLEEAAG